MQASEVGFESSGHYHESSSTVDPFLSEREELVDLERFLHVTFLQVTFDGSVRVF